MATKIIRENDTELTEILNETARRLHSLNFAFGALFISKPKPDGGSETALVLNGSLNQEHRMELLADLQKAVDASRKAFQMHPPSEKSQ